MLNIVSLVIGAFALLCTLIAFIPPLGLLNWGILPISLLGLVLGALSDSGKAGRNLCLFVVAIGVFRLAIGGWIF